MFWTGQPAAIQARTCPHRAGRNGIYAHARTAKRARSDCVSSAQKQFPGFTFRLGGPVDVHHNLARFTWELAPAVDQEAIVVGFDVAVLAPDGRLQSVHGFLDKVPAA
jgi:hypothetical protein